MGSEQVRKLVIFGSILLPGALQAQVELRGQFARYDIRRTRAGDQIAELQAGWLEMTRTLIPDMRAQFGERGRHPVYRIVRALRIRDMTLDALHGQAA